MHSIWFVAVFVKQIIFLLEMARAHYFHSYTYDFQEFITGIMSTNMFGHPSMERNLVVETNQIMFTINMQLKL